MGHNLNCFYGDERFRVRKNKSKGRTLAMSVIVQNVLTSGQTRRVVRQSADTMTPKRQSADSFFSEKVNIFNAC